MKHNANIIVEINIRVAALILLLIANQVTVGQECPVGPRDIEFAHCPNASRNFKTVLLAVHGWNGDCRSTFGRDEGSLFNVLDARRFYDWDCFQYDSHKVGIRDNTAALAQQLQELREQGYERVMLVTHSTGGILALQLLTDMFLSGTRDIKFDPLRIDSIQAWATPINGLRACRLGDPLAWFNFSPAILPDLKKGSGYLKELKQHLSQFNEVYLTSSPVDQGRMKVRVNFFQGQGNDLCVNGIDAGAAEQEGWYWPDRGEIIVTDERHTHNIGESGRPGLPRYPAGMLRLHALLSLQVSPRYDEVFPVDTLSVPRSLENRQSVVIDGLSYYASENFTGAFSPALEFLARMYNESFARSAQVDEQLVDGFLNILERRVASPDDDLVRFYDSFVKKVLSGYDPSSGEDIRKFGHRHSSFAVKVLKTAELIRQAVNEHISRTDRKYLLAQYGSVDAFNSEILSITKKFLDSSHSPVQYAALSTLAQALPEVSDASIADSKLVATIASYYKNDSYRRLASAEKATIGSIFSNLAARPPKIQETVLASLNDKVSRFGQANTPLWATLSHDKTISSILKQIDQDGSSVGPEQVKFVIEVAGRAGATGNDTKSAKEAVSIGAAIMQNTESPGLRDVIQEGFEAASEATKYPAVRKKIIQEIQITRPSMMR